MLFGLCSTVLVLALLTGGGTHTGFYGDIAVQVSAIPLLLMALWPAFDQDAGRRKETHAAVALCCACGIVILLQVFPIPFDVWSGRKVLFPDGDNTRLVGAEPGWSTLSITPQATWAAAASFVVPLSIFGAVSQLRVRQRVILCWVLLGAGGVSLVLGFLQVAQGPDSPLRFYAVTNPTEAVGFFANRNHFAAFLIVTLVLTGLWFAQTLQSCLDGRDLSTSSYLSFAASAACLVALFAGLALARSRAGVLLGVIALAGIVLIIVTHSRSYHFQERFGRKTRASRISFAVALFAVVFALQFGLGRLLNRFESDPVEDLRVPLNITTFETAFKALPFGTGLGSFVSVYGTVEKSQDVVASFANRAHNDLAEFLLETGLVGAVLVLVFLIWFGHRVFTIWIRREAQSDPRQVLLDRASTVIVALLLCHSLVDYPLRTTALGAVFALFCGILAAPIAASRLQSPKPHRHSERPKTEVPPGPLRSDDVVWPDSWQRKDGVRRG